MAFTQIAVTGNYQRADGTVPTGEIRFTPTESMRNDAVGSSESVPAEPVTAELDENGALSITLAATNDPDTTPPGVTYLVEEMFREDTLGRNIVLPPSRSYYIDVPYDGGPIDLAEQG